MNTDAIVLDERFTDFELAQMFNIELVTDESKASRVPYFEDEPYNFNDVRVPLLRNRKRKLSKRVVHFEDHVKSGVTREPAGKSRVADLARFYAENPGESAFDIPGVEEE